MATEFESVECRTGEMSMVGFAGKAEEGYCVQLTFKKPEEEYGRPDFGYWYTQLTKQQALDLAAALVEFVNGQRDER